MAPFANPLPDYPQPAGRCRSPRRVAVWYVINAVRLFLARHVWANALERQVPIETKGEYLRSPWTLQLGPLLALLRLSATAWCADSRRLCAPPTSPLLWPVRRVAFSLAVAFKVFPLVLAIFPLLRRDWTFLSWTAGRCLLLLVGLPVICVGPATTFDLYRAMLTDHLAGLATGSLSPGLASEVSPERYSSIGVGAVVPRITAGRAFYSSPLPDGHLPFSSCSMRRLLQRSSALVAAASGTCAAPNRRAAIRF